MANRDEVIKKLSTIVTNQQKIITKMAQQMGLATNVGSTNVSLMNVLNTLLENMPEANGVTVESVTLSPTDGSLKGKVVIPDSFSGTDKFRTLMTKVKSALAGKNVTADDGNSYMVTSDPLKIQFIGMSA